MIRRMLARGFIPSNPSPIPMSGLKAWYKGDVGVTLSGSDVLSWADQSGNHNDITPPLTPPTFNASSVGGKPGITFGVSSLLTRATAPLVSGSDRTVIVVSKPTTNPAGVYNIGGPLVGFRALSTGWFGYVTAIGATVYGYSGTVVNDSLVSPPTILDVPNVMEISTVVGSPPSFVFNGTTYAPNPGSGVTADTGTDGLFIGATDVATAATQYFAGDICEIIIYNRVLAGADLATVRAYILGKYGVGAPQPPAGMRAWYDAAKDVTVSGSDVSNWGDQSGNGFDLTPGGGNDAPTLHAGIVNGKPGVLFDTVNGNAQLNSSFTGGLATNSPRYVVAVLKPTVPTVGPQPAGFSWGGPFGIINNGTTGLFYPVLGDYTGNLYITGGSNLFPDPTAADTAYAYEWGSTGVPGSLVAILDGTVLTGSDPNSYTDFAAGLTIGSDNGAGNGSFSGYICEILIYDHVLTGADLTQLRTYVNTKYAL